MRSPADARGLWLWACLALLGPAAAPPVSGQEPKPRVTLTGHKRPVLCVAFSPDGKLLASGDSGGMIKLWDAAAAREIADLRGHKDEVGGLSFVGDGKTLASVGGAGGIRLWDVAAGRQAASFAGWPRGPVTLRLHLARPVAFSGDGKTLAMNGATTNAPFAKQGARSDVMLWDVPTGRKMGTLSPGTMALALSRDARTLASAHSGEIKLWDVSVGKANAVFKLKATLEEPGRGPSRITALAISPDGKTLASGHIEEVVGADGPRVETLLRPWDVPAGKVRAVLRGHAKGIDAAVFSGDGKTLASGDGDGVVKLWDVATGKNTATLQDHATGPRGYTTGIHALAFSPDGRTLASGSHDLTVRLWDVSAARQAGR